MRKVTSFGYSRSLGFRSDDLVDRIRRRSGQPKRHPVDHHQHAGFGTARCAGAAVREKDRLHRKDHLGRHRPSVGAGGQREADVTLAHAPSLEKKYVADGKMHNRRLVMYNDFIIIGPRNDPAKIRSTKSGARRARSGSRRARAFVSRGDKSGTHMLEKALWKQAGIEPKGAWYIESGQGMGATLGIANDRHAYTITDRATYLAFQKRVTLPILVEGDSRCLNIYSVMEVNPANGPRMNTAGGKAFADFMLAPETQAVIKSFGVEKYGQPLFVPVAGKKDEDL